MALVCAQLSPLLSPILLLAELYIMKSLLPFVVRALQPLAGERATDTSAFGSTRGDVRPPVFASQQLSGRPIAVHSWERDR
ncbi:hypothetical protein BC826DRAFT_1023616 [Russula brevipes]|nr:hypothetical protein BC826DRAFT_1023616 [Russula brevipes]